ncbi:hypothetical protein K4F52_006610 [Lecanicillium sp. MT-2017a]|nr:hypothetical protein K4F52_006610 [Lecanicillium sp. MT-2017a]
MKRPFVPDLSLPRSRKEQNVAKRKRLSDWYADDLESSRAGSQEAPTDRSFYDGINHIASQEVRGTPRRASAPVRSLEQASAYGGNSRDEPSDHDDAQTTITETPQPRRVRDASPELGSSFVVDRRQIAEVHDIGSLIEKISTSMKKRTWTNTVDWMGDVLTRVRNTSSIKTPICDSIVDHMRRLVAILTQIEARNNLGDRIKLIWLQVRAIWKEISSIQTKSDIVCTSMSRLQEGQETSPLIMVVLDEMRRRLIPALVFVLKKMFDVVYDGVDGLTQEAGVSLLSSIASELQRMALVVDPGNEMPEINEDDVALFIYRISRVEQWAKRLGDWMKGRRASTTVVVKRTLGK